MLSNVQEAISIIFVLIGPISLFASLLNIYTISYVQKRKTQSDIFMMTSVYQSLVAINFIMSGAYQLDHQQSIPEDSILCRIGAYLQLTGMAGNGTYQLFFIVMLYCMMDPQLKSRSNRNIKIIHIVLTLLIVIGPGVTIYFGSYGLNQLLICGMQVGWTEFAINIMTFLIFLLFSLRTWHKLKHEIPESAPLLEMKNGILKFYFNHMASIVIIWGVIITCDFFYISSDFGGKDTTVPIAEFIQSTAMISFSTVMFFVRYNDQNQRQKIYKALGRRLKSLTQREIALEDKSQLEQLSYNPEQCIIKIGCKIRMGLIVTILSGISLISKGNQSTKFLKFSKASIAQTSQSTGSSFSDQGIETQIEENTDNEIIDLEPHKFQHSLEKCRGYLKRQIHQEPTTLLAQIYDVDPTLLCEVQELCLSFDVLGEEVLQDNDLEGLDFVTCRVMSYCPTLFNMINEPENIISIYDAFKVINNKNGILNFSQPTGGKSGEFFFFSSCNRLIIKTLTKHELKNLLKRVNQYFYYCLHNKNSLICKLVGVFSFSRCSKRELYHVLVMRSVSSVPSKYVLSTYDMKGSTFDRKTLSNQDQISKQTLKDDDFFRLEGTIKIDSQEAQAIREALFNDADFFKSAQLMDYSLLVIKIDLKKYSNEINLPIQDLLRTNFRSRISCVQSQTEDGVYYAMGIIDYLQDWNYKKNFEKNLKKILNANINLDTSAQDPSYYAERFKTQLVLKILPERL